MPHCARERRSQPVHWPHWDFVAVVPRFCNIWKCVAACNPHFQSLLALFTLHHWQLKLALEDDLRVCITGLGWRKQRERHVSIGVASLSWCHQGGTLLLWKTVYTRSFTSTNKYLIRQKTLVKFVNETCRVLLYCIYFRPFISKLVAARQANIRVPWGISHCWLPEGDYGGG